MRIKFRFNETDNFPILFRANNNGIKVKFNETIIAGGVTEYFDGEYTIVPKVSDQTVLETKAKAMKKNVTVLKIPYSATSNLSGGYTATIGG